MLDQKNPAVEYLRQNKDKFPPESLRKRLIEAGYPLDQIAEASRIVYGEKPSFPSPVGAKASFWDFKNVRVYQTTGEKFLDVLFGFFILPFIIGIPFTLLFGFLGFSYGFRDFGQFGFGFPILIIFIPTIIRIVLIFYFWQRRRYIVYGLIASLIFGSFRWWYLFYPAFW